METFKVYEDESGNIYFKAGSRNPDTVRRFCENAGDDFENISRKIYERLKDGTDK